jgi:hypothetical protein
VQYQVAGVLMGIGVLLWIVTVLINRRTGQTISDPTMDDIGGSGAHN